MGYQPHLFTHSIILCGQWGQFVTFVQCVTSPYLANDEELGREAPSAMTPRLGRNEIRRRDLSTRSSDVTLFSVGTEEICLAYIRLLFLLD